MARVGGWLWCIFLLCFLSSTYGHEWYCQLHSVYGNWACVCVHVYLCLRIKQQVGAAKAVFWDSQRVYVGTEQGVVASLDHPTGDIRMFSDLMRCLRPCFTCVLTLCDALDRVLPVF